MVASHSQLKFNHVIITFLPILKLSVSSSFVDKIIQDTEITETVLENLSVSFVDKKMMSSSSHAKILIGISLDPDESKELLSWVITVLAHPNDQIVAVHILG